MSTDRDAIRDLEADLDALEARVKELERGRRQGPDVERFAERFVDAVLDHIDDAGGDTGRSRSSGSARGSSPSAGSTGRGSAGGTSTDGSGTDDGDDVGTGFDLLDDDAPSFGGGDAESTDEAGTDCRDRQTSSGHSRSESGRSGDANDGAATDGFAALDALDDENADRRETRAQPDDRRLERARQHLAREVSAMDETTRLMLAHYLEEGPDSPMNAHFAAGGADDRTRAYAHNRRLRTADLIQHVGRGEYDASLRSALTEAVDGPVDPAPLRRAVADLEDAVRAVAE